jgi:hypothetical protein
MGFVPAPSKEEETAVQSAPILSAIAVLSEVGESALQKTRYSDGGVRRKDFDADPSSSLFLSGMR